MRGREEQEAVGFSGPTDRLYLGASEPVQLETGRKGAVAAQVGLQLAGVH